MAGTVPLRRRVGSAGYPELACRVLGRSIPPRPDPETDASSSLPASSFSTNVTIRSFDDLFTKGPVTRAASMGTGFWLSGLDALAVEMHCACPRDYFGASPPVACFIMARARARRDPGGALTRLPAGR